MVAKTGSLMSEELRSPLNVFANITLLSLIVSLGWRHITSPANVVRDAELERVISVPTKYSHR